MTDWRRNIEIDPDWQDYKVDLTAGWAEKFLSSIPSQHKLGSIASDLVADLRAAQLSASLPYLLTSQLVSFDRGAIAGTQRASETIRIADGITSMLIAKVRDSIGLTAEQMSILHGACLELKHQLASTRPKQHALDPILVWKQYTEETGFNLMVWGAQRTSLVAAYSGLENFLLQCVATAKSQPTYVRKGSDEFFGDVLAEHLGDAVADISWRDHYPTAVRLARHAILHFGGRESDKLRDYGHPVYVHPFKVSKNRLIHIKAHDVVHLLRHIEQCAEVVLVATESKRQFIRREGRRKGR